MIEAVKKEQDVFLPHFAALEREGRREPSWLARLRRQAFESFSRIGFPTPAMEEWKYTPVRPIARTPFLPAPPAGELKREALRGVAFADLECPRMVFVNGRYAPGLSSLVGLPGSVRVLTLEEGLKERPEWMERFLGRHADWAKHCFVALNTALMRDGAIIEVPEGCIVEKPVHLLYLTTEGAEPWAMHPRNLIVVGRSSQVGVLESYVGLGGQPYLNNHVTEIVAAENAVVDHYRLLQEGAGAFHVSTVELYQERSSSVRTFNVSLGGLLVRNEVNALMDGEGAESALDGLYLIGGEQHVDNHTRLEHAQPHCSSREIYKGILDGAARAVFHGRIVVRPGAQKTDSKQTNNNLLLSDRALVTSKPQLEIYADDVKCTHGATIGQLDPDALFYLRCRGIDANTARSLLVYAFAMEVINRIKVETVRRELDDYLFSWLPKGHLVREAV